jgi:dTMP kinase
MFASSLRASGLGSPVSGPRSEGSLIAFEGLDQSGKQTQAERLVEALTNDGRQVRFLSFPDYHTAIGAEIGRALHGEQDYAPDVMQLLYIANRYEYRPQIESWLRAGIIIVCDRYLASSVAYGEAQELDAAWLTTLQKYLPQPSLTVLLDIPPDASLRRKERARDRYERDLALLARVRDSYKRQATQPHWIVVDGSQDKDAVTAAVLNAVQTRLAQP